MLHEWISGITFDDFVKISAAISSLMAAAAAMISAYHGWQNSLKLQSIHVEINGRLTELMRATNRVSFSEGVIQGGLDEHRTRSGSDPNAE